jgi:hypothetical protein
MEHLEPDLEAGRTTTVIANNDKERRQDREEKEAEKRRSHEDPRPRTSSATSEENKYIIDWEEDDPENPLNWSLRKKWMNLSIVSLITLVTYVRNLAQ